MTDTHKSLFLEKSSKTDPKYQYIGGNEDRNRVATWTFIKRKHINDMPSWYQTNTELQCEKKLDRSPSLSNFSFSKNPREKNLNKSCEKKAYIEKKERNNIGLAKTKFGSCLNEKYSRKPFPQYFPWTKEYKSGILFWHQEDWSSLPSQKE